MFIYILNLVILGVIGSALLAYVIFNKSNFVEKK
jgi:hypothetical protein